MTEGSHTKRDLSHLSEKSGRCTMNEWGVPNRFSDHRGIARAHCLETIIGHTLSLGMVDSNVTRPEYPSSVRNYRRSAIRHERTKEEPLTAVTCPLDTTLVDKCSCGGVFGSDHVSSPLVIHLFGIYEHRFILVGSVCVHGN